MAKKKTINLAIPEQLLEEFNAVCQQYGHAKQKGQVLSAAILMFLRADPTDQGRCLEDVVGADITAGVAKMIDRAKREQGLRIATREAAQQAEEGGGQSSSDGRVSRRWAAKEAGDATHGLSDLPTVEEQAPPTDDPPPEQR